jgi:D-alanyl-D-alanine carboxypeptidase
LALLTLAACQSAGPRTAIPTSAPAAGVLAPAPALGFAEERGHAAIVVDAESGRVLFEDNADALRYPASLTKMMSLYLLFEAVESGRLSLDDALMVSAGAAARPPAKIGLAAGSTIRVRDAIQALAVKSANDVAVAVAENLGGSEDAFAAEMTSRARMLGMTRTRFVNASGLPDPRQVTTARDMAILGQALKARFPRFASMFAAREFSYGGRRFEATNNLLGVVPGVDGIKTGYIRMSGYNLVASARRGGRHLIVVVMGGATERARDTEVAGLIEQYFEGGV